MPSHLIPSRRVRKDRHLQQRTQFLTINIISAHNLDKKFCHKKLYASVYAYPDDQQVTNREPCNEKYETAWNDQFVVRVDDQFLKSETSTINVSVYAVRDWNRFGRNHLIGSTRIVISTFLNHQNVALQIREPKTLEPVGVLNVTVSLRGTGRQMSPNNEHDTQIISMPHSYTMRFGSKHKVDKGIRCTFLEQQHKSGPLDQMQEQERTKQKNIKSKIKQWINYLAPIDQPNEHRHRRMDRSTSQVNLLGHVNRHF